MKLHMFKEEYVAELEALGIKTVDDLTEALEDDDRVEEIKERLKGVGPKTIERWQEDLGVVSEKEPEEVKEKPEPKPKKAKAAKKPPEKEEKAEEGEEVEIEEEGEGYEVKLKPKLPKEVLEALKKRCEIGSRRPEFLRQEWHRRKRLQRARWRKPKGDHSKMRQHYAYRRNVVSIGYGSPKGARHLHPSGFREVMVWNVNDLDKIKPELEAARVAHQVGMRKRLEIESKADELGIRILNRSG
jgi:large subunit ribosomal protein L32e